MRIVQISDVHLGEGVGERRLRKIVAIIEEARPDLLVCTGDLVDASFSRLELLAGILADLQPPLGKFAVTGNHEHYLGLEQSLKFHEAAGFRVLRQREDEQLVVLTPTLIPPMGSDLSGADYEYLDTTWQKRGTARYYVEDVDLFGTVTRHAPVVVEIRRRIGTKDKGKP